MPKQFLIQPQSPQTQHKIQQSLSIWSSQPQNYHKNYHQHQLPTEECHSNQISDNTKIMLQIINNLNINQYVQSFNSNTINKKKDQIVLDVIKEKMLIFFTEYEKMCREFVLNVQFEVVGGKRDRGERGEYGGEVQVMFQYLLDANQLMTSSEIKQFKQYLQQYPLSKKLITHTIQQTRTSLRDELLLLFYHITSTISQHLPSSSPSPSPSSPCPSTSLQVQKCQQLHIIQSISITVWEDIKKSNKFYELIFKEYIENNNLDQFLILLQQLIEKWVTLFVDLESRSWEEYYDGEEEEWVPVIRKESGERGRTWDKDREEMRQPGCRKIRSQLL